MSKTSALKKLLTAEQKHFLKEKTLSSTMKVKDWIGFLSFIAKLDKEGDQKVSLFAKLAVASFVLAVVSFFITPSFGAIFLIVPVSLVVAGIVFIRYRKKLKTQDINNYLREFFIPALHLLKEKAGEQSKLSAKIDFRNPRTVLKPEIGKHQGRNQKRYLPVYIIAKIVLKDESLLEFVVQEDIKDLKWKKRSSSGKIKFKTKTKLTQLCTIKMTLLKTSYTWKGTTNSDVDVSDTGDHYLAKTKAKVKKTGENILHVKVFIDAIQAVYDQFEPVDPVSSAITPTPDTQKESDTHEEIGVLAPYIWYGGYFDRYDYDSFDHTHYEEGVYEEGGATVFDS
ncbi:MAG: hypothetical protein AAGA66_16655 [Bacteroidota bacterium]